MNEILPTKISAGLTFSALATLTAYPAPDWILSVALRGPASIDLVGAAEGVQHRLQADAVVTAAYAPGLYAYSARVARDGVVLEVDSGQLSILADLAAGAGGDMRTHSRIVLDNIRAVIEKRATRDQERYAIEGQNGRRELWRTPLADLLQLEALYLTRARQEEAVARGDNIFGRQLRMRLK